MRFVKGIIVGLGLGAGVAMMLEEGMMNKNVIMKKGKQIAKKNGNLISHFLNKLIYCFCKATFFNVAFCNIFCNFFYIIIWICNSYSNSRILNHFIII